MPAVLMKCGHSSNGVRESDGAPVCVICYGIVAGADEVATEVPSLEGRRARCSYCREPSEDARNVGHRPEGVQSDFKLPFFSHQPDRDFDEYYCGCFGWD